MDNLRDHRIVAVIRAENSKEALFKANLCISGGINVIEITFSFADCCKAIELIKQNEQILVGAGTVLSKENAQKAIEHGADFIVSPHTDIEIIDFSKNNNKTVISGASTSNEIVAAHNLGADMVKIFPADIIGGPKYVKAIKEPLPFAEIFVTGGINLENCNDYIASGASLIGVAGALFPRDAETKEEIITENARKFVEKLNYI
ncbi:MAG: bifunctional 4-hydroxy-2-oxoglutarate aldolase/2-dehydro-3-deoxy-phosphogluconate aldolase [Candidatus Dadabacteria bacterium]|nr:bifunctional 4-hydroxy-2-oxoglutarate aldolase/2-dehydro-3-deoxy-phosphogluconate aldolase [Candidatus Dadabacteria bacterium]NIS08643.1 bifunctional 4-hydroxy-2-oxoglutarate aldolase/2-dehydro-3-deoxy-phosphogluconate aldolase [Candidatus Dadabacteria bacterium]NIV42477.1 bifunctional 4-hydroxy-2-oxoglutarate aldolase/2-dehydro-3-deoxy-phosphogluconate aldolase [Candidatus Dadabacteria bacterium]NIX15359.1 bifunctional 4-hydroxy-2-oxoglutarate aldolase/2-dehydro-3-deoxy-phosphogluconate aldo